MTKHALLCISLLGCGQHGAVAMYGDDAQPPAPDSGTPMIMDDGGVEACATVSCSEDLHSVLDCRGNPIQTCAPNEGCANGKCIPACAAVGANPSSRGCDFYAVHPKAGYPGNYDEKCWAAIVANTWNTPVTLSVEHNGYTWPGFVIGRLTNGAKYMPLTNGSLQVGEAAVLFLSEGSKALCPVQAATLNPDPAHAFHIIANAPVSAYSVSPFTDYKVFENPMGSGTLLLPTPTWGTNYMAFGAYDFTYAWAPFTFFVASENNTTLTLGAPISQKVTLAKGQLYSVYPDDPDTAKPFIAQSDKPIGVWAGHQGMVVDTATSGGGAGGPNAEVEQQVPIKMLGTEYAVAPHRGRTMNEPLMYRIVGAVDGTTLTYVPSAPQGAPLTIKKGESVYFETPSAFVVKSQDTNHPFYVGQYMPTFRDTMQITTYIGPELANVVPPAQFLHRYVFYAVPPLSEVNVVVVRKKGSNGFADVNLDCVGKLTGFTPLGDYEWTRVDLVDHDKKLGSCDYGRHEMKSDAPFGIMVWSWQATPTLINGIYLESESFGYPGGLGLSEINSVVVPPN